MIKVYKKLLDGRGWVGVGTIFFYRLAGLHAVWAGRARVRHRHRDYCLFSFVINSCNSPATATHTPLYWRPRREALSSNIKCVGGAGRVRCVFICVCLCVHVCVLRGVWCVWVSELNVVINSSKEKDEWEKINNTELDSHQQLFPLILVVRS